MREEGEQQVRRSASWTSRRLIFELLWQRALGACYVWPGSTNVRLSRYGRETKKKEVETCSAR